MHKNNSKFFSENYPSFSTLSLISKEMMEKVMNRLILRNLSSLTTRNLRAPCISFQSSWLLRNPPRNYFLSPTGITALQPHIIMPCSSGLEGSVPVYFRKPYLMKLTMPKIFSGFWNYFDWIRNNWPSTLFKYSYLDSQSPFLDSGEC